MQKRMKLTKVIIWKGEAIEFIINLKFNLKRRANFYTQHDEKVVSGSRFATKIATFAIFLFSMSCLRKQTLICPS